MSSIMQGINKEIEKQIKKGVAEKLNASCANYYGNNKELQNMITKKDFADIIKNVKVSYTGGHLNISVDPKDKDAVKDEDKDRFDKFCNEFFSAIATEYFDK